MGNYVLDLGVPFVINNAQSEIDAQRNQHYWDIQIDKLHRLNEQSADKAQKRTLDLYFATQSPQAIKKQLLDAGLNPGLMYSKGGMGGQISQGPQAQASSVQGFSNQTNQIDALTLAQIKNLESDSKLKDTKREKTELEKQTEILNQKLTEANTLLANQNFEWNKAKWDIEINNLKAQFEKTIAEIRIAEIKGEIDEATKDTKIKSIVQEYNNLVSQGLIMELEQQKIEQQIKNLKAENENIKIDSKLKNELALKAREEIKKVTQEINRIATEIDKIIADTGNVKAMEEYIKRQKEAIDQDYSLDEFTKKDLYQAIDKYNDFVNAQGQMLKGVGSIIPF